MNKKQFIIDQLAPYLADSSTCGFDEELQLCQYYTNNGKMCVAGKNLIDPKAYKSNSDSIENIIINTEEQALKPESRGILTPEEWQGMQFIHDAVAAKRINMQECLLTSSLERAFSDLGVTYEELKEAAQKIIDGTQTETKY